MSCEEIQARLLDHPLAEVGDHLGGCTVCAAWARDLQLLDQRVQELPLPPVPVELVRLTLDRVAAERALEEGSATTNVVPFAPRAPRTRVWAMGGSLLAMAAVALFWISAPQQVGDPAQLVEKGVGERQPEVALKIAVQHQGHVDRLSRGERYSPGDILYFRAQVDLPAWVVLVRSAGGRSTVVHRQQMSSGEADLVLEQGPLAWRIESGEGDATYALLASSSPIEEAAVVGALQSAYDPGQPGSGCKAIEQLGARCVEATVQVEP